MGRSPFFIGKSSCFIGKSAIKWGIVKSHVKVEGMSEMG